jgi:hypothetical protein
MVQRSEYYTDKATEHRGVIIVEKYVAKIFCMDCNIEVASSTENNAKKLFTKRHKKA